MNIAVFYNVSPGGAKRVVFEQCKYLHKHKHKIDVFTYKNTDESYMPVYKFINNIYKLENYVPLINKGFRRIVYDFTILVLLNFVSKSIAKKIDSGAYDIVLVHPDNYTQAPYILRYLKTPSVYFCEELLRNTYEKLLDVDDTLPIQKYFYEKLIRNMKKGIDKENARRATLIMTASNYIKDKVKQNYNKDAVVDELGVNMDVFKYINRVKGNYLLFIGKMDKITGYYFAKSIIKELSKEMKLILKVVNSKTDKLRYSDKEMSYLYSKAFLTLCVSHEEPFGLSSIESMACGTPVLAINEGGYKESVIDGITGYLLERDPKLFIDKIMLLYKDNKLYNKMSKACALYVKKKWTWEEHGAKLNKQLESVIKTKKFEKQQI